MNTVRMYDALCSNMANGVIRRYSTSFRMAVLALHPRFRDAIRGIYAFVRLADEIVDTFQAQDRKALLERFRADAEVALAQRFSLNPVLHNFQRIAHRNGIAAELIEPFLHSMAMDLERSTHDEASFKAYVHGSAEVVGLMCLKVFAEGDAALYGRLSGPALRLGAAFQKVNFLRDLRDDQRSLGRSYFPGLHAAPLDKTVKARLEAGIQADLDAALAGIRLLPNGARFGVYLAYTYNRALFRKIQRAGADPTGAVRVRISNPVKVGLAATSFLRHQLHAY